MLHILTCCLQGLRSVAVSPSRWHLWTPIGCSLKERVWLWVSSLPLVSLYEQKGGTFKSPSLLRPLLYTQADSASVMAGAAHWHLPNSRGMPLSPTTPPCFLWRQTGRLNWAESRQKRTVWQTRPHISKTKWKRLLNTCHKVSSGLIFISYLRQRRTVGLDT